MARVSRGVTTHARHKKVIKRAKGYYGRETEEKEKVTLGVFGYNVSMQV